MQSLGVVWEKLTKRQRWLLCIALGSCMYAFLLVVFRDNDSTLQSTRTTNDKRIRDENDVGCPFRHSSIYRKVYVYPSPGEPEWHRAGDVVVNTNVTQWPWLDYDADARRHGKFQYDLDGVLHQFSTELLVRELLINPESCLRTYNPEEATLFYIPYLPSTEGFGKAEAENYEITTSPYATAIRNIIEGQNYTDWENLFGLSSKYWKRRNGTDHILVFSEPINGLYHPLGKRGNFHYVYTQKQLEPPIVISIELSTAFVQQYPNCAVKNILLPYPNADGRWFNGKYDQQAHELLLQQNSKLDADRPILYYYKAGLRGICLDLRTEMTLDYETCSHSYKQLQTLNATTNFGMGMRLAKFCPCPGGDSPSAKRMFDAVLAGCIPVVLSQDFVWPMTTEYDASLKLNPNDFSIRLSASDFDHTLVNRGTCHAKNASTPSLEQVLSRISKRDIRKYQRGMERVKELFQWYKPRPTLPDNPLQSRILPDGGLAHWLVQALADRASGEKWEACRQELTQPHEPDATSFVC